MKGNAVNLNVFTIFFQNLPYRGGTGHLIRKRLGQSPSLSIVFELSSKTQWLSGLYYTDFISFYSPTIQWTIETNSNELPISSHSLSSDDRLEQLKGNHGCHGCIVIIIC